AVETVDQAVSLLTGIPAGEADAEGDYPDGTLNQRVQARLQALNRLRRAFHQPDKTPRGHVLRRGGGSVAS
ncbi:MAG TPA: hypothetical protein VEQ09_08920, partial [Aquabacterium sp.]|nr:hypothetical protein [Aquabacterium sp.]